MFGTLIERERSISAALLACGIVSGLVFPPLAKLFQPLALPALFLVIVLSLVPFARMQDQIGDIVRFDVGAIRIVGWQQVILPAIIVAIGFLTHFSDQIVVLMMVTACAGSLFASPAFAEFLGLDKMKALKCMVLSTIVMPFSLYCYLNVIHESVVSLDIRMYLERAFIFMVVPFCIFAFVRPAIRRLPAATAESTETMARWLMLAALIVFGIGILGPTGDRFAEAPGMVLFYLLIATALGFGMMAFTVIVMYRHGATEALTAGVLVGFRNVGLGYALVGEMAGPDLAVYVGVSQLPTFLAPLVIQLANRGKVDVQSIRY